MAAMSDHQLLLYRDTQDFLTQVAAVLEHVDGLVVTACRPGHNAEISALLGRRLVVERHRFDIHTRPAAALATYRRRARRANDSDRRVIVIAEHDPGAGPGDWHRAARWEAAANLAFAAFGVTSICAYPTATPDPLLTHVTRTHPRRCTADGPVSNPGHTDPVTVLRDLATATPIPPPADRPRLRITGSTSLYDSSRIRRQITEVLAGVPTLIRTDFVAAVNEVLTNGYLHGVPPLDVTLWATACRLECRVTDRGAGQADPVIGYRPSHSDKRAGAGLWLARQACDDIDMWCEDDTFTVRVATAITGDRNRQTAGAIARAETARIRAALIAQRHVTAPVRQLEQAPARWPRHARAGKQDSNEQPVSAARRSWSLRKSRPRDHDG
jgi:anti-sigma regulatory factor (Ser/Thr protein kinase)